MFKAEVAKNKMRCTLRDLKAADRRRDLRKSRPPRGEFQIDPNCAVPLNISDRGALDKQVMSTDSIRQRKQLTTHVADT